MHQLAEVEQKCFSFAKSKDHSSRSLQWQLQAPALLSRQQVRYESLGLVLLVSSC